MEIICTYCSRKKDESEELLPAIDRYKGEHIIKPYSIAQKKKASFYFVSGLFGLIPCEEKIPYYEFLLNKKCVDLISLVITKRLIEDKITSVIYYSESIEEKTKLKPYKDAIEKACIKQNVNFQCNYL